MDSVRPAVFVSGDLTAQARIRDAAMDLFARQGFGASIRAIADAAGVSSALITHHFGTKEALRRAVDDAVIQDFSNRLAALAEANTIEDLVSAIGRMIARVGPNSTWRAYLRRSLLEGTDSSIGLFEELIKLTGQELTHLQDLGGSRGKVDRQWGPYQVLSVILGPLLLEPLLQARLGPKAYEEPEVSRWILANLEFVQRAVRP
jgi:AcrR family transcriptional regulator